MSKKIETLRTAFEGELKRYADRAETLKKNKAEAEKELDTLKADRSKAMAEGDAAKSLKLKMSMLTRENDVEVFDAQLALLEKDRAEKLSLIAKETREAANAELDRMHERHKAELIKTAKELYAKIQSMAAEQNEGIELMRDTYRSLGIPEERIPYGYLSGLSGNRLIWELDNAAGNVVRFSEGQTVHGFDPNTMPQWL